MSFSIVAVSAIALSTAVSYENGRKQASIQKQAMRQAKAAAEAQATQADQEFNKANRKQPDTMSLLASNQQSARGGVSGTMLTGSTGVDPGSLLLGKNTLLGM